MLLPQPAGGQPGVTQSIELGQLVQGVLTDDDAVDPYRGNWADLYTLQAYAGQRLEVLLTSEAVDTFLILEDTAGLRLAEDDDSAGNLDSRIIATVPLDGLYTIIATSYGRQEGPYELLVRELRPQPVAWAPLEPGRSVFGSLTDTDATRSDDRRIDGFAFDAEAGQQIRLTMASEVLDSYLYLIGPTGELLAENDDGPAGPGASQISLQLPHTGRYQVVATSLGGALGDYEVRLEVIRFAEVVDTPIELGEPAAGRLEDGDGTWGVRSTWADGFTFQGRAGQQVHIAMTSAEIDSYLVLLAPDGTAVAENDDAGGTLDSALSTRLPADGEYRIIATSFELNAGNYLVSVEPLDLRPLEHGRLSVGQRMSAELSEDDPLRHFDPAHLDLYELCLEAGERVVVAMRSQVVNPYLWVVAPTGEILAEDDDSGGGLDALVELTATHAGEYLVVATSYPGLTGPYEISALDADVEAALGRSPLEVGERLTGRLEHGDSIAPLTGSYRDSYTFEGTAGTHAELRMESFDIDPYLMLLAPSGGVVSEDDDSGGGLNARIQTVLPEDGTYVVYATSFTPSVGTYSVGLERFEPRRVEAEPVAAGDLVEGALELADPRSLRYGTLLDVYRLAGEQGQRFAISMVSVALDSYLVVVDPNGELLGEDDDSGGGLNARLEVTLPVTGDYRILATSSTYGIGSYHLGIEEAAAPVPADPFGP